MSKDRLPSPGHALSYFEEGAMPPIKALALFFESWYRLGRQPTPHDYAMLYRALKEMLPAVKEWPQEPVVYWSGEDLNGTPKYQAILTSYEKFKEYLDPFGPLFDAHEFIKAYESGEGAEYVARSAKAKANREAVQKAMEANPDATQQQIADAVGLSQSRVAEIIGELSANDSPNLLNHGGKREKQGYDCNLEGKKRKRGSDPEYIKSRLARDAQAGDTQAAALLGSIEAGDISAHKAAQEMGWVKEPDPARIVEKQREKLSPGEQVKVWREWGRALPDEAIERYDTAQEAFLNLTEMEQHRFIKWAKGHMNSAKAA